MKKSITPSQLEDAHSLTAATSRFGYPVAFWDDGCGPLWIHRDSMGITGITRAQTWEDAYSAAEDELFPAGDEEAAEAMREIEATPEGEERDHLQACYDEVYGYRGSARQMPDGSLSSIYAKDLNGDSLDLLTDELAEELEITLEIDDNEPEPEPERFHLYHWRRTPKNRRAFLSVDAGRYGTRSRITAGYRGSMRRILRHENCSPTWENPGAPTHNPDA